MDVKTIKGIDAEKWMRFKALAAKKNVSMGKLFEIMVEDYEKNSDKFWADILKGEKILSEEEAKGMHEAVKKLRRDKGFRI